MTLDTSTAAKNIETFVRVRASTEPVDVTVWFSGNIYGYTPGEPHKHLFTFEGFNIGRAEKVDGGYSWVSREAVFYKDAKTGEILEQFTNPYTGEVNDVLHVWNDPVNGGFVENGPRGAWGLTPEIAGNSVNFATDVFLMYPNPLQPGEWPRESCGPMYQGAELFRFIARRSDLEGDSPSVPCDVSWVRMAPFVPWMLMGTHPGHMVYHTGGQKLMGGYKELPAHIRKYTEQHRPEYAFAPKAFVSPNETSWTFYAKERRPQT
jgi:Protein of unknown function (DUF1838)